jgi:RHS repeat-associated protein
MRPIVPRDDVCSCSYVGSEYANPHAVTSVGGTAYSYDNNGNATAIGSLDYTWDWRNRLRSAERTGGGNTTYGYDHTGQRVFKATGTATTSYPNRYFNLATTTGSATTTKHIFAPDGTLLATVEGNGVGTATTTYLHADHLGGTNVATDADGAITQTLDYYPYGSQRIATGSFSEQRKFTGHEHDQENDLTYANARYYEQNVGKWLSQDPASRDNPGQFLTDPQQLNSYAYGRNNPLRFLDQSGEVTFEFSRPIAGPLGFLASHNAIAGYNVPGFPKGLMTIGGYNPSSWSDGPFGNDLITMVGSSAGNDLASGDYQLAQQIISGDASGVRGLSLIKDFGGLTEGEYWKSLLEGAAAINAESGPYNSLFRNSHSALNSMKNYANPGSTSFKPTWQLTPAAGVNVMPGYQTGSASSASSRSSSAYGLSADTRITSDNVGAFISFISQFLR